MKSVESLTLNKEIILDNLKMLLVVFSYTFITKLCCNSNTLVALTNNPSHLKMKINFLLFSLCRLSLKMEANDSLMIRGPGRE